MSLSESYLRQKQRRFWRKVSCLAAAVVLAGLALSAFIFLAQAIVVEVAPREAERIAARELDGFGFVIADKVYLVGRRAALAVSAEGFVPQTVTLERDAGRHSVTVTLSEARAVVKAAASPGDAGVRWEIDGKPAGEGVALMAEVEPGPRTLTVSHPYYETQVVSLDLKRGAEHTLAVTLEPVRGGIKVSSEPQGVQVTLDGEQAGKTPVALSRAGGGYYLEIKKEGFVPIAERIEVTADHPRVDRNYRLAYKKARIDLALSPPAGQLLVNGKLAPVASPLMVEPLREITMTYSKAGYFPQTVKKLFEPAQAAQVAFSLSPEFGEVTIDAVPAAAVALDGKAAGLTPQTFNLRAVTHTAILSKAGYRAVAVKFKPTSKHATRISKALKTELEARLEESAPRKVNSIGVELVLFDPRQAQMPFTIGAPRAEQGQRANEFLRTTRLAKPFYAGSKEISAAQYNKFRNQAPAGAVPAGDVTWNEAAEFCNWLSAKEKLSPFYAVSGGRVTGFDPTADGYRLLSEAEWEWLARYAKRPESARFVWGNETVIPPRAANIADESAGQNVEFYVPNYNDGYAQAAPVGSLTPDAAGLYDMAGNVSEWVNDVYTLDQVKGIFTDPLGPQTGAEHVVKGSSWRSGTLSSLRSSFREGVSGKRDDLGFRIGRYIYGAAPQ